MPHKPARPCKYPGCVHTTLASIGYCQSHEHFYQPPQRTIETRPSSATRGYNSNWQTIRDEVLQAHGIPKSERPSYDVHHTPEYNPEIEPNHRAYKLTPLLHEVHSRLRNHSRGRGIESLELSSRDRSGKATFFSTKMEIID